MNKKQVNKLDRIIVIYKQVFIILTYNKVHC